MEAEEPICQVNREESSPPGRVHGGNIAAPYEIRGRVELRGHVWVLKKAHVDCLAVPFTCLHAASFIFLAAFSRSLSLTGKTTPLTTRKA